MCSGIGKLAVTFPNKKNRNICSNTGHNGRHPNMLSWGMQMVKEGEEEDDLSSTDEEDDF